MRGQGEGTIVRRKDGRWTAALTLENGKRKWFYGKTKAEVGEKLRMARGEVKDGTIVAGKSPTLDQFAPRWLEDVVKPRLRASTHLRYSILFRKHILPSLGKVKLEKLTPQHVQRLYSDKLAEGLAPGHVDHIHRSLHVALKTALRWNLVGRNICDMVDPPTVIEKEKQVFNQEQARAFLDAIHGDYLEAMYIMALTTGMRMGELRALRWDDLDLDKKVVQVRRSMRRVHKMGWIENEPKTRKGHRVVPLIEPTILALRKHRTQQLETRLRIGSLWEGEDRVFGNGIGKPLEDSNIARRSLHPILDRAGLPKMRPHDLRHSAATILHALGVDLKTISEILGHANISITADTYTHVDLGTTREAVARLNSLFK